MIASFRMCSVLQIRSVYPSRKLLSSAAANDLVLTERKKKVTRVKMNNPKRLNGWTVTMLTSLFRTLDDLAEDEETEVVVLTGTDPYYCAGASLSEHFKLMHPRKFHSFIAEQNELLFGKFLNFPKPILIAANGPAVGGAVTSALLCDGEEFPSHPPEYNLVFLSKSLQESSPVRRQHSTPTSSSWQSRPRVAAPSTSRGSLEPRRLIKCSNKESKLRPRRH